MSNTTIRDLCAAMSGDVDYLIDCVQDGSSDPATLQECADRAEAARDLLAAEPVGEARWYPSFADWLEREMPEGTVIGDPLWWASRIADYLARWGRPAAPPAPEVQRDAVIAAVTEALGGAYDCLRVWEAWSVGTMGQDDFALVAEDSDRVAEIADAAIEAMRPAAPPVPRPEGDWFAVAIVAQDMQARGLAEQTCGEELLKLANSNRSQPARPAAPAAPGTTQPIQEDSNG